MYVSVNVSVCILLGQYFFLGFLYFQQFMQKLDLKSKQ